MARIAESSYELAGLNRTPTDGLVLLPYCHAPLEVGQVGSLLATPHVIMAFKLKVSHFCARGHDVQSNKSRTFLRLGAWRPGGRDTIQARRHYPPVQGERGARIDYTIPVRQPFSCSVVSVAVVLLTLLFFLVLLSLRRLLGRNSSHPCQLSTPTNPLT